LNSSGSPKTILTGGHLSSLCSNERVKPLNLRVTHQNVEFWVGCGSPKPFTQNSNCIHWFDAYQNRFACLYCNRIAV